MVPDALRVDDRYRVLRDRADDGDDVDLLHAELAHAAMAAGRVEHPVGPFDLSGDEEARRGVEPRAGDARHGVRSAGAGRQQGDTETVRRLRIIFCGDGARLFVRIAHGFDIEPAR